jgi:UPF0176 protein
MSLNPPITVAALYRFTTLDDLPAIQVRLAHALAANSIKGTILIAHEGINGTIAGGKDSIECVIADIKALPGCADVEVKYSHANEMPFYRMKVRIKQEIVTMGVNGIDPLNSVGTYVPADEWNNLIKDSDTIIIDTRNDYEVAVGSFDGAVNPRTKSFREFPAWFRENRTALTAGKEAPKFAMFCTGGIRCEKSTAFLKQEGINNVYHLKGGILRYLETVSESDSRWHGECFVFDERVSVTHGLRLGSLSLCHACRRPVDDDAKVSENYIEGVCCPACYHERDASDRARFAERQHQIALAKARGEQHIGKKLREHE